MPKQTFHLPRLKKSIYASLVLSSMTMVATATDLIVRVSGLSEPYGSIGCSMFSSPLGFPMDSSHAKSDWVKVNSDKAVCTFKDIPAGQIAVSVAHDINGNKVLDTNFFGIPTEQWGVSNNARPKLRAPKFEEALFIIDGLIAEQIIDIKVAK